MPRLSPLVACALLAVQLAGPVAHAETPDPSKSPGNDKRSASPSPTCGVLCVPSVSPTPSRTTTPSPSLSPTPSPTRTPSPSASPSRRRRSRTPTPSPVDLAPVPVGEPTFESDSPAPSSTSIAATPAGGAGSSPDLGRLFGIALVAVVVLGGGGAVGLYLTRETRP